MEAFQGQVTSDELHSFCFQYILEPSLFRLAVYLRDPGSAGGDRAGVGGARVGARQEGARILNKCLSPLFFSLQTLLNLHYRDWLPRQMVGGVGQES